MYMDPNMPETWREPVKRGILSWNRAFEKAGFREVIRVEDFPKDDPAFNPYGINTSCVWYAPSNIENAEGHFWTDPRTGEIRGATMVLHQHVAAEDQPLAFRADGADRPPGPQRRDAPGGDGRVAGLCRRA